ncbi:RluA family pseudouridine synthase [Entomospira culicis]|uniref:RluA family pseudouridine synthase n=1 Tax=Entomospira culicis TaxID=2719989 RepID=A0A968KUY5_9SPIO|nr:RluA family pseudouridine synthase [Entomospira culicis]NIZ19490.1 RluA family pseudouridine synthase [Entomospira culicis]NIZ69605.1 RluA family pseudouridine synthase [Entomospira culicis]WDI36716.1 RluA family pseudouridine synthase [Entomospira culicis]WDI38345.1 RluA family pseudouridine synthase [Entomospira culicis]
MKLSSDSHEQISHYIKENDASKRLDVVARRAFPFLHLAEIFQAIRKGTIKVNGKKSSQKYRLVEGDILTFVAKNMQERMGESQTMHTTTARSVFTQEEIACYQLLEILWESQDFVAINKPVGWISHGNFPSLTDWLIWKYGVEESLSFNRAPVHRLDVGTTGVIILAKTSHGARQFFQLQEEKRLIKIYLAIVDGKVSEPITSQLYLYRQENKSFCLDAPRSDAKLAITHIYPLKSRAKKSLIACVIETGRTHQIRAVCAHYHHPLSGDALYNPHSKSGYNLHHYLFYDPSKSVKSPLIAPPPPLFIENLAQYNLTMPETTLGDNIQKILQKHASTNPH